MHEFFRLRIRIWGLLTAAGFFAIIGTVAGFAGRYAWWLDLGSHYRVQYVFLFAVIAFIYALGRKWNWAAFSMLLVIVNAIPVAQFLLPRTGQQLSSGSQVRAMLLNVNTQHGEPDTVNKMVIREHPDVLVLEEINKKWIDLLSPALTNYTTSAVEARDDNFGIAMFTRLQCITSEVVTIGLAGVPSAFMRVLVDGKVVSLLATHPLPPGGREYSEYRNEQLERVAEFVDRLSGPIVLLGDLNVTPWSPYYRDFIHSTGLQNSSKGRSIHATWPTFSPLFLIPIDHCLHSADVKIYDKRVGGRTGSDHFPIVVDFGLKQ